jgi:hypothetical protein
MNEITYFDGRPFFRKEQRFRYPSRSAKVWLLEQSNDSVTIQNAFFIDGDAVSVASPVELKPLAIEKNAAVFSHHITCSNKDWTIVNYYSWTWLDTTRYKLWLVCKAFIDDDSLAVQFKLSAPWEDPYEQV